MIVQVTSVGLASVLLVLICRYLGDKLFYANRKQAQINFDCEQAILKKQRLEKKCSRAERLIATSSENTG